MDLSSIDKTANLSQNNSMSLMVFKMASESSDDFVNHPFFGVNIFKVKEVLEAAEFPLSMVPNGEDNSFFKGMIKVRGDYISIYDTAGWLGYPDFDLDRSVIILTEINGKQIGIHVAYIHGVFEKEWGEIQPSENLQNKVVSETKIEDNLCLIMDIEKMVAEISGLDFQKEAESTGEEIQSDKIVLFADDSKSIRDYVTALMNNLKIRNVVFDDGKGLLEYVEKNGLDNVGLVLTDLEMPNVSGHTVIKAIKENPKYQDKPVVVHTSMTVGDSERQAKELGADDFIGKIDSDRLEEVFREYL